MKRDVYLNLLEWKKSKNRKPLILQGARQVGKTYILKIFGETEYKDYLYINFDKNKEVKNIFEKDLEPERVLSELELLFEKKIKEKDTLLIFDEIQECPNALNSLKYFNEEAKEYHIVAAGSLLGVKLNGDRGFPVGQVNFLNLYPLNFAEFLDAISRNDLRQALDTVKQSDQFSEPIHNLYVSILKQYMFIGGMPRVVKSFRKEKDYALVRKEQNEIIKAYMLDFAKHADKEQITKLSSIWDSIPRQLAKENKKFQYSVIEKNARTREYYTSLQWLINAGLIYEIPNVSRIEFPLKAFSDSDFFKVYLLDVGILGALCDLSPKNIIEDDVLFGMYKGAFTENFVCQELKATYQKELYYWTSEGKAEVDFIFSYDNEIYPLEVKAGTSKRKKSLAVYGEKYNPRILSRTTLRNFRIDGKIINYPLYMISKFPKLGLGK
jgi:uncharacterized protein